MSLCFLKIQKYTDIPFKIIEFVPASVESEGSQSLKIFLKGILNDLCSENFLFFFK